MRIRDFTKSDEYPICIAMIRMQYELYNNIHAISHDDAVARHVTFYLL